jgi:hypothetical protein
MATSSNINTTGNYSQSTLTNTGTSIGTIGVNTGNSWTTIPNYMAGTITSPEAYTPKIVITDCPLTYDSKHSDGNTYQHEVAAIQVTRDKDGEIIKSKMVKVFWVETRSQGSIDYAASKDPAVSEFEPNDIIIKTLRTIKL